MNEKLKKVGMNSRDLYQNRFEGTNRTSQQEKESQQIASERAAEITDRKPPAG